MKPKILATCIAVLLLSAINADSLAGVNDSRDKGISGSQLRDIADSLPPSTATIEAIQFLRTDNSIDRAAILMYGETTRWQIFVFRRQPNDKFALESRDVLRITVQTCFRSCSTSLQKAWLLPPRTH